MILAVAATCYLAAAVALADAPAYDPFTGADEVLRFSFESDTSRPYDGDRDFDAQPDSWSRRKGPGFPAYVSSELDQEHGYESRQSLRVDVNGGEVVLYSPLNDQVGRIDPFHAYVFEGRIRTQELTNDAALISVSFLNHKRQRLQRFLTQPVTGTHQGWQRVTVGPLSPQDDVRFVVIGCHIVSGDKMDVRGRVWFDELWLGRLPQLTLGSNFHTHFKQPKAPILIESYVNGLDPGHTYEVMFQMTGGDGKVIDQTTRSLEADAAPADPSSDAILARRAPEKWELPPQPCGYYRVQASLLRDSNVIVERQASFAVMDIVSSGNRDRGEFGWSIERGLSQMDDEELEELADIAAQGGINWLKLPLWDTVGENANHSAQISRMLDLLVQKKIVPVGLLNDPPPDIRSRFARDWTGISEVFTMNPRFWSGSIDQVIAKYSSNIRHWQLGGESDVSFVGLSRLPQTLETVRREINRIGRDTHVGLRWDWDAPLPKKSDVPRTFLSLDRSVQSQLPLSESELTARLKETAASGIPRWVLLRPLDKSHPEELRGADLVKRMVAAKIGGAEAIYAADVLDDDHGILQPNGAPALLFLPWRTTSLALQGADFLGSFPMPAGSRNYVFAQEGEAVVVMWNPEPVVEDFYFGENVQIVDIWGVKRPATTNAETNTQQIQVTDTPVILRNCSEAVARWRLAVKFAKGRLPSAHAAHRETVLGVNTFSQGVSGEARLNLPRDWEAEPADWKIPLSVGEQFSLPTNLTLPANASLGQVMLSIDFDISAERQYKFRVYYPYEVGLDDVKLHITEERLHDDTLRVEQVIVNDTQPMEVLNFQCSLFVLGRKRKSTYVIKLEHGENRKEFLFPGATELRGKAARLRVEQINGPRVLNKKWIVGEDWESGE